ncbi:hypothetical protein M6D81_29875 [Paenibacillus sp. J5C_2022]|nr:hypothetical protein [Paenibacillus sp. J5C2022]
MTTIIVNLFLNGLHDLQRADYGYAEAPLSPTIIKTIRIRMVFLRVEKETAGGIPIPNMFIENEGIKDGFSYYFQKEVLYWL